MGLLLSVVALLGFQSESATGPSEIRFLARHQSAYGSWGEIPEDCRCLPRGRPKPRLAPEGITVDPEIRRVIDTHIRNLGEDDIRVREASTFALLRLGDATGPQLAAAAEYEGPEVKFRCREVLQRLRDRDGPGDNRDNLPRAALLPLHGVQPFVSGRNGRTLFREDRAGGSRLAPEQELSAEGRRSH
jgi:hypothetical protein